MYQFSYVPDLVQQYYHPVAIYIVFLIAKLAKFIPGTYISCTNVVVFFFFNWRVECNNDNDNDKSINSKRKWKPRDLTVMHYSNICHFDSCRVWIPNCCKLGLQCCHQKGWSMMSSPWMPPLSSARMERFCLWWKRWGVIPSGSGHSFRKLLVHLIIFCFLFLGRFTPGAMAC